MRWWALSLLSLLAVGAPAQLNIPLKLDIESEPGVVRVTDLNDDGIDELLVIDATGAVRTHALAGAAPGRGTLQLPDPDSTLVTLARMFGAGGPLHLVTASRRGLFAYACDGKGVIGGPPLALAPTRGRGRPRFRFRTGRPLWCDLCQDVNNDGFPDLILPSGETCELWLHPGASETKPFQLQRTARLAVRVKRQIATAGDRLSDTFESSFTIPRLDIRDVNGDGRADIRVVDGRDRAWHLQQPDGTMPPEPSISLDLRIFKDTTPSTGIRPGRTLAGSDRQQLISRDLDGDGIPDAVIAHRRKVWVFHGTQKGPQFTRPAQILRAADDVTMLLLLNLDDDGRPDLVIVKVVVPSVTSLILGALSGIDVEVSAVGYRSEGGKRFATKPFWRSELEVELPSIASVMKDPYAIIRRFDDASRGAATVIRCDLDGDGRPEIIQPNSEANQLAVWLGSGNPPQTRGPDPDPDQAMRHVLFEEEKKSWDLDRLVTWVASIAQSERVRLTGPRNPDITTTLRPEKGARILGLWPWRRDKHPTGLLIAFETLGGNLRVHGLTLQK